MTTDSELWARGPAEFIKQQVKEQKQAEKKRIQDCHIAGILDGVSIKDFAILAAKNKAEKPTLEAHLTELRVEK